MSLPFRFRPAVRSQRPGRLLGARVPQRRGVPARLLIGQKRRCMHCRKEACLSLLTVLRGRARERACPKRDITESRGSLACEQERRTLVLLTRGHRSPRGEKDTPMETGTRTLRIATATCPV